MKLRPLRAHLAHVAQHQQARGGQASQHVDGGPHGIGVRVVGVVDQREGASAKHARQHPRTAFDGLKRLQPACNRYQRHASGKSTGNGRQRILHVVQTSHVQRKRQWADRRAGVHLPGIGLPEGCGADNVCPKIGRHTGPRVGGSHRHVLRQCARICIRICSSAWRNRKRQLRPLPGQCVPHRRKGIVLRKHSDAAGSQ